MEAEAGRYLAEEQEALRLRFPEQNRQEAEESLRWVEWEWAKLEPDRLERDWA